MKYSVIYIYLYIGSGEDGNQPIEELGEIKERRDGKRAQHTHTL
jgi:hypothetical protein